MAVPTRGLVEGIDRQSAEKLGVEVGGFLGHDFTGEGNIADLGYAARIHQENNVGTRAALQMRQGLGGIANVGNILLVADGFFSKVQNIFQQDLMELHNVKRLLTYGKAGKVLRGIGIGMVQQKASVGGDGEHAGSGASTLAKHGGRTDRVDGGVDFIYVKEGSD